VRNLLALRHQPVLARFASANVLVAFDYDGTLAPIAQTAARARMRPSTRRLLTIVAERYPTVVISGRARADLLRQLRGIPVHDAIGNHGMEPWEQRQPAGALVRAWTRRLTLELNGCRGVDVENKGVSLTIHYRRAAAKATVKTRIERAARRLAGARVLGGKCAINIMPLRAPDKADALERLQRAYACDHAIYVGDDITDEDVFARADRSHVLSVRVGRAPRTHASFYIPSQKDIDTLLAALLAMRPPRFRTDAAPARGATAAGSRSRKYRLS
jgi:trehalose 6-phosphate phosphatase